MVADVAFADWIEDAAWDTVMLGEVFLPGVCTVEDFEYGQDIDVQKRRKKEKARIRDNGLAPCGFNIKVELTAREWPEWLKVLPSIQPRREGGIRQPLAITHPLPNSHGVRDIYVHKIRVGEPSARKGMVIVIKVAEWFEEEKDAVATKKSVPETFAVKYSPPNYTGDPKKLRDTLMANQGYPPADGDNIEKNLFDRDQ